VKIISDRTLYVTLTGWWCNIIAPNVHTPCEDKSDDIKDCFYEQPGCVFDHFPRYDMKNLVGDFSAKVGREDIFKSKLRNESSHEISNNTGVKSSKLCHI
jgi:hypothetical protein